MSERTSTIPEIQSVVATYGGDESRGPCQKEPCEYAAMYGMTCDDDVFGGLCGAFEPFPDGATSDQIAARYRENKAVRDAYYEECRKRWDEEDRQRAEDRKWHRRIAKWFHRTFGW